MISLDEERVIEDEYEKEYFGFSSTEFIVDFADDLEHTIKKTTADVQKQWKNNLKEIVDFEELYFQAARKPFKLFQKEVRNYFKIPENLKPELCQNVSDIEEEKLLQEIEKMKEEYAEESQYLNILKKRKSQIDELSELIELVEKSLNSAQEAESVDRVDKLKEFLATRDGLEAAFTSNEDIVSFFADKLK